MKSKHYSNTTEVDARVLRLRASVNEMLRHPDKDAIVRIDLVARLRDVPADLTEGWSHMDPDLLNDGSFVKLEPGPIVLSAETLTIHGDEVEILLSNPTIHGFLSGALLMRFLGEVAQHLDAPENPFSAEREVWVCVATGCTSAEDLEEIRDALRRNLVPQKTSADAERTA